MGELVVAPQPSSLEAVEDQCLMVESWAESCESIPQLRDASNKLAAISEYLELTSVEGRARVAAAQRRLEVRIGQLLPSEQGRRTDRELPRRDEEVLSTQQKADFRAMAGDPDTVEDVIASSTDDQPASRRKVTEAIKANKEQAVPASLDKTETVANRTALSGRREEVAQRVAEVERLAAKGFTSSQIAAELGYTPGGFSNFKHRHGLKVPADAVVGKSRHLNCDRIVNETTTALEGLCIGLGLVGDPKDADLDPDQIATWATSLNHSLRILTRFTKQLKEMTQ